MGRMIDAADLVSPLGIAKLLGLAHSQSVHTLRRRHPDFPHPVWEYGRTKLWLRSEVTAWARAHGRPVHD